MSPTKTLIQQYPLKKIKIIKKTLSPIVGLIFSAAFIAIPLTAALAFLSPAVAFFILAGAAVLLFGLAGFMFYYQLLYYNNYFYDLTPDGLVISKGVFGRWKITVPAHKVQDVYLDQDLLDRVFGLYDLHLSTATDVSQREAHIDGVGSADAQALRGILLKWITGGTAKKDVASTTAAEAAVKSIPVSNAGMWILMLSYLFSAAIFLAIFFWPLAILSPLAAVIGYLQFKAIRYELRKDGVFIRTGFLIPRENIFLYRNIQDVEDTQGVLERFLGIHTLLVKTMTDTSAAQAMLNFVLSEDAKKTREEILERSKKASKQAATSTSTTAKAAVRRADVKTLENPFKLSFLRSARYSALVAFCFILAAYVVSLVVLLLVFAAGERGVLPAVFILAAVAGLALVAVVLGILVKAVVLNVSYSFAVASDVVRISIKFIASTVKQIPYTKVQDIEKHISFSDSFAGLAEVTFETGAKDYVGKEGQGRAVSMTTMNETVPALLEADADKLKKIIADRMGVDLAKIGENPLVTRIPLSKRKPLKKTLWWTIIPALIIILLFAAGVITRWPAINALLAAAVILTIPTLIAKYFYEKAYLRKYFYDANSDVLVIRKGVFGSRELTIPFTKIQEVFIDRDILDLAFGLYDIYVSTATGRSVLNAHVDGVTAADAEAIALLIVERIAAVK
ncbi:Bacterial PH domain protein [uncultured archaeon]|nr:Bacterial PH domain protein [uncultured archaeon]